MNQAVKSLVEWARRLWYLLPEGRRLKWEWEGSPADSSASEAGVDDAHEGGGHH